MEKAILAHKIGQKMFDNLERLKIVNPQNSSFVSFYYPEDTMQSWACEFWVEGKKYCIPIEEPSQSAFSQRVG